MEENKNITPEVEENFDIAQAVKENKSSETAESKKAKKSAKIKKIKNQAFLKKGSYSLAITAIVIAGIIVFNVLIGALSDRFILEFDMTTDEKNSISEDNIKYLKNIDEEIVITVCAGEETYREYLAAYTAPNYGVSDTSSTTLEYYDQTVNLVKKYADYNDNITVRFVDPQSSEFGSISQSFSDASLYYGDIIVSRLQEDGNLRYKTVGYSDIYALQQDEEMAYYGYNVSSVAANNVETAVTGAIAYAVNDEVKQAAILIGHSEGDMSGNFAKQLENNNFETTVISDSVIEKIDSKYDVIIFPAPSKDFLESEIAVISDFLDNKGQLNKGMMVFADASSPYLENFYDFLGEWGFAIEDGILFETYEEAHAVGDPTTIRTFNTGSIEGLDSMQMCYTGYNVPMKPAFEKQDYMAVASVVESIGTTVAAPRGTPADWTGAADYEADSYSTVMESIKAGYNDKDEEISTSVSVFSSIHFLQSEYNESADVSNKNLAMALAERAAGIDDFGISFYPKEITSVSYAEKVTEGSARTVRTIFIAILPMIILFLAIVVYIRRRNAE